MTTKKEKDFETFIREIEDPNSKYPWVAKGCPENPTPSEKVKYNLCQKVLAYKQDNHLSTGEVAKKIKLKKDQTQKLLFGWISEFTLDQIVDYANRLFSPSEIEIVVKEKLSSVSFH